MSALFLIIFALQGLAMLFDEFYFHRKRGLPSWERIGHPLDTLSVLICYSYLALTNPSSFSLEIYVAMSAVSCLFVTKDEWVHKDRCQSSEHWLHAVLFILHPLMLFGAYSCAVNESLYINFQILFLGTILMFLYQVIYWNLLLPLSRKGLSHD